jgi:Uma2 family endonuclease
MAVGSAEITWSATVDDLYRVPENGKAELVDGELVLMSPTGARPGRAATKTLVSLAAHEEAHGGGTALGDNVGFLVNLPNRRSFSPDVAWIQGTIGEQDMKFVSGAPAFAVEVRSEGDYDRAGIAAIQRKIRDYFAAGTLVVWDVDLLSEELVRVYRASAPDEPEVFRRGELADAEPAVPGWRFLVDRLFQ